MTEIFDGYQLAQQKLTILKQQVEKLNEQIKIVAICFQEDKGSLLYSEKKQQAATKVGMQYEVEKFTFQTPLIKIIERIQALNFDKNVSGIIIQKPSKKSYLDHFLSNKTESEYDFISWWGKLTETLKIAKDIDGLSPANLEKLKTGQKPLVLPATVQAVLESVAKFELSREKILIIGRSDLLGLPLYYFWKNQGFDVTLSGKSELNQWQQKPQKLQDFSVIVAATGQPNLITGELIANEAIIIDVGEPKGDVDLSSCIGKAKFITPVPGGIGPVTVACLLENSLFLSQLHC